MDQVGQMKKPLLRQHGQSMNYFSANLSVNFGLRQSDSAIWILSGVYPTDPTNTTVYTTNILSGNPTRKFSIIYADD